MTKNDIIRMAQEAGMAYRARIEEFNSPLMDGVHVDDLAKFAALVAAAAKAEENEACAKVCEAYTDNDGGKFIDHEGHGYECAAAIRARGNS